MTECISRFILNRWVLNDLPSAEMAEVEAHLTGCAECRATVDQIKANMDHYAGREKIQFQALQEKMKQVRETAIPRRRSWRWVAAPAVAAAAAVLLMLFWPRLFDSGTPGPQIQYKGALSCKIFVKRGETQFQAKSGIQLQQGDHLRFEVTVDSAGFLTVFSIDSKGIASPFYPSSDPENDTSPYRLEMSGKHLLPGAVELDGSTGEEVIAVVFSNKRFNRKSMHKRFASLAKRGDFAQLTRAVDHQATELILFRFPKSTSKN